MEQNVEEAKKMVPTKGFEPSPRERHGPEPCASANSAMSALKKHHFIDDGV